ncbi:ABC transporter permease [bacterium 1xD8-48]|jgi:putative ABC transport system permease protein|nr:ABC transporter permease [bacterium 1xD8-48]
MFLLIRSNIKKSGKTSFAFFLLLMATMLLSYTGSQMTEGFRRLYQEKATETNSADFAAILPRGFYEKYGEEIEGFRKADEEIIDMEMADAVLLRSVDIQAGTGEPVNGSWMFRNADRQGYLSSLKIVERLEQVPENGIYVPYVCKTFFGFEIGDVLNISSGEWQDSYIIAGFTEDVLFGSRSNIAFDLPKEAFLSLREKAGTDCDAVVVMIKTDGDVSRLANRFSEFVAGKSDGEIFYNTSDIEYAEASRSNNLSIYVAVINAASVMGIAACFMVIAFHMRNTLDKDLKELGTLKAVGYRGGHIVLSYALQFLFLGLLGGMAGVGISQCIMPMVIKSIATDIGFVWNAVFLGFEAGKNLMVILLVTVAVTVFLSKGIFRLRPVEAIQEREKVVPGRKSRMDIEKTPFPVNLSVIIKMISFERARSILTGIVVSVLMCVAGFAVILYARLVNDKGGLLQVTGAEVYSVNVQPDRPEDAAEIAKELEGEGVRKVMMAVEPGSSRLLCDNRVYAALGVYSDYEVLENPSIYAGRYPKHENETAISGNLAQALGKNIGDTVEVSQLFQEDAGEGTFLIVGLTQGTYTGGMDIYLTMEGLNLIDSAAQWQTVHVYLEEGIDAEEYCRNLKDCFSDRLSYVGEFEQVFYSQLAPIINSVSGVVFFIMAVMFLLIVIMGYFVTNSILLTRKRDFGIMKALGYSNGQIISQTVVTFMLYIAGGSLLGSIFLYFGSNAVMAGLFHGMGVYRISFRFPIVWIAALILCMEAAGCLTAFISAWKVRKIVPSTLIKAE